MNRSPAEPIEVLRTLLPALLALLGVAAFTGVAAGDIRGRYQPAADILVVVSTASIVGSIIAATYPFALERPLKALFGYVAKKRRARKQRRDFLDWLPKWKAYCSLLFRGLGSGQTNEWWDEAEKQYAALRPWLVEHEHVPRMALKAIAQTVETRWRSKTTLEYNLVTEGFFYLFQDPEFLRVVSILHVASDNSSSYSGGHHAQWSLQTIWEGLNRFSIVNGWGQIDSWEHVVDLPDERSEATAARAKSGMNN